MTKVFPRSHTVAAQGGIAAAPAIRRGRFVALARLYDTVRARTGWATRTPSNTSAATRPTPSMSSNISACRSRPEGKTISAPSAA